MKKLACALLALAMAALLGCGAADGEEAGYFRLWYLNGGQSRSASPYSAWGTEVYAGAMEVPGVMNALLAGPSAGSGLTSPIPAGTRLLDWSRDNGVAWVDLSREYESLAGLDLTLADYCITLTLTQLEGVEAVRITAGGSPLPARSRQILRAGDVVLSGAEEEPVDVIAALCFRRAGGNELGEERRIFRLTESQSATLAVLQALLSGPQEAGLVALLPPGLEVYSARVEAGVCYADFSAALLAHIPDSREEQELVVRSIVGSLCSLDYVQAVQLLVEGETLTLYGSVDVSGPLS